MRISASQIKTFKGSKAQRAGKHILKIKDVIENDSYLVGLALENWLLTGEDRIQDVIEQKNQKVQDEEKMMEALANTKYNSEGLEFEKGESQVKVEGEIFGVKFVGYIDNLTDERIDDIKTCKFPSKEDGGKNMWSNMTSREEYALQLWMYMKALNRDKARIIEISKHKYKDGNPRNQIIEFKMTKEFDDMMMAKRKPVVEEMISLHNKFGGGTA